MTENIQIEKLVQQQLTAEGRNVTWLCEKLHWQRKKYYRFLFNGLIEVHELQKISILLNHDFVRYFSLPPANQN
ncbi:hypothetical protein AGMMS49525_01020 [Bacteroidia bacterium]|nr:hypothetical protein AGMMS49525_01020 [Bacteroidia bacterium]